MTRRQPAAAGAASITAAATVEPADICDRRSRKEAQYVGVASIRDLSILALSPSDERASPSAVTGLRIAASKRNRRSGLVAVCLAERTQRHYCTRSQKLGGTSSRRGIVPRRTSAETATRSEVSAAGRSKPAGSSSFGQRLYLWHFPSSFVQTNGGTGYLLNYSLCDVCAPSMPMRIAMHLARTMAAI